MLGSLHPKVVASSTESMVTTFVNAKKTETKTSVVALKQDS